MTVAAGIPAFDKIVDRFVGPARDDLLGVNFGDPGQFHQFGLGGLVEIDKRRFSVGRAWPWRRGWCLAGGDTHPRTDFADELGGQSGFLQIVDRSYMAGQR